VHLIIHVHLAVTNQHPHTRPCAAGARANFLDSPHVNALGVDRTLDDDRRPVVFGAVEQGPVDHFGAQAAALVLACVVKMSPFDSKRTSGRVRVRAGVEDR